MSNQCRHDNIVSGELVRDANSKPIGRVCPDCGRTA